MQDEIDKLMGNGEPAGKFAPTVPVWSEMGVRAVALRVQRAAQHRMHLTAFGAFLAGGFVGGLLMLIVLVGLYGGR